MNMAVVRRRTRSGEWWDLSVLQRVRHGPTFLSHTLDSTSSIHDWLWLCGNHSGFAPNGSLIHFLSLPVKHMYTQVFIAEGVI